MVNFVELAQSAGLSGTPPKPPNTWNWGIIEAGKGNVPEIDALTVANLYQGLALVESQIIYGPGDRFSYNDFSKFSDIWSVNTLKLMNSNGLLATPTDKTADATTAGSFTSLQYLALKLITEQSISTAPDGIIEAAQKYTSKTRLYNLYINLDHGQASIINTADPEAEALDPENDEWEIAIDREKIQVVTTVQNGKFDTAGDGLTSSDSTINIVSANTAIVANTDNIELSLKTTPGLEINSGLGVLLDNNSGLGLGASGLSIRDGDGLSASAGKLNVDLANNSGLEFSTAQLTLNLRDTEPGLELTASGVGVHLKASNPGLEISSGLGVKLQTTSGLAIAASGLAIGAADASITVGANDIAVNLKDTNPGIELNATGLAVQLKAYTPGLEINSGLGVLLDTNSGLGLAAGGLSISNGDATINIDGTGVKVGIGQEDTDTATTTQTLKPRGLELYNQTTDANNQHVHGLGVKVDDYSVGISASGELQSVLAAQKAPLLASVCAMGGATSNPSALLELFKTNVDARCDSSATSLVTTPPNTLPGNDRMECLTYIVHIASGVGGTATVNLAADNGKTPGERCSEMFDCAFDEMSTSGQIKTGMQQNSDLKDAIEAEICAQHLM